MTAGDQRLLDQAHLDQVVDLTDLGQGDRVIDPEIIRRLSFGPEAAPVDPRGLRVRGARFEETLDMSVCEVRHPVIFVESTFAESAVFNWCSIPALVFLNCDLPGLAANSLDVTYLFSLEQTRISGEVLLTNAKIGGDLDCSGATCVGPEVRFELGATTIGGSVFFTSGFRWRGQIRMLGARVRGALNCESAKFSDGAPACLDADLAVIDGGMQLSNVEATGEIRAVGSEIGSDVVFSGAKLRCSPGGLTFDRSKIAGTVFLDRFTSEGPVRFVAATINGSLICINAKMNGHPEAFTVSQADVAMWLTIQMTMFAGQVSLESSRTAGLIDDLGTGSPQLGSWSTAQPLLMSGFDYARFGPDATWDLQDRSAWLQKTQAFDPQAWHQLADVYSAHGREGDARQTAIEGQNDRLRRASMSRAHRIGRWLLWVLVGHGYRPWLAGIWATAFIAGFALCVGASRSAFVPETQGLHGHPEEVAYAADAFLPIVDLGEADKWTPRHGARWVEWPVILIGWALTTLFVAGFTSIVRRT